MTDWMKSIFGDTLSPVTLFIVLFIATTLAIVILLWLAKKLLGGTFVSGGRGRHLRLAVMDATPVDSRRRLVLVRRDDVEHLILIGGPTDVVVEQNIRLNGAREQAANPAQVQPVAEAPAPVVETPRPAPATPAARPLDLSPRPQAQPAATSLPPRPVMPPPTTRYAGASVPVASPAPSQPTQRPVFPPAVQAPPSAAAPVVASVAGITAATRVPAEIPAVRAVPAQPGQAHPGQAAPIKPTDNDIDEALLADLSESMGLDGEFAPEISLEKEMESLLGTLDPKKDRISRP